jgi:membrane protein
MGVFLLASVGIRIYLIAIGRTGYTYGALAAPIAFLLFTFFIGLAIVIGAHFNSAIQEMWPAKMTSRQRRWRRLEMYKRNRTGEQLTLDLGPEVELAEDESPPADTPPRSDT